MQEDANGGVRKKKIIITVGLLVTVLFVGVLIGVMARNNSSRGDEETIIDEKGPVVTFSGVNVLSDSMGASVFGVLTDNMKSVIEMPDESVAEGDENGNFVLDVTVDTKSFIRDLYFPYTTYSFLFKISDGRYYNINVATDGGQYCGILVQRFLPTKGQPYLYITGLSDAQDWQGVVDGLTGWARSVYPDGFTVTTEQLK